ncbi:hypothetical protein [Celeribacter sp. ULVN23_4]
MRRNRLTRPVLAASALLLLATPALANGPQGPQGKPMVYPQQQEQMRHQERQRQPQPAPKPVRVEKHDDNDLGEVLTAIAAIGVLASVLN